MTRTSAAGTLVGRQRELAELHAGLADARRGHGRLFLIAGDPGIGKTRLVEAFTEDAAPLAMACWGRCWESGGAPPYWPWKQVLRRCVDQTPRARLAECLGAGAVEVAELVPELSQRLPGPASSLSFNPTQARLRLFDSVIGFLIAVARDHGALMVAVDDLHAADEASLQLLRRLARALTGTHLLVVGTYRDADAREAPGREHLLLSVAAHGQSMMLDGLDRAGVAALLERVTGNLPAAEIVNEVQRVTEGNPFFVGEAARLASADDRRGILRLPGEVHDLVRQRLEPLLPEWREVLRRASLLGQDFELSVLRRVADTGDDVLDALGHAAELGVVEEVALARWAFAHALLREALQAELTPEERVLLHRRAGEALEDLSGHDAGPDVSRLAHHFWASAADGADKAVTYCTEAAAAAMAALAYEDAVLWWRRALDALGHIAHADRRRRYDLLVACADAEWRSQGFGQAKATYREAMRVAEALDDGTLVARAALGFAQGGGAEHWIPVLERALTLLHGDDDPLRSQVVVELALSRLLLNQGDAASHVELAREAMQKVRHAADADAMWYTLWSFHRVLQFDPQALGERLSVSTELVELAEQGQDSEKLFRGRSYRVGDLFDSGDITAVERELTLLDEDARRSRVQYFQWVVAYMTAAVALHRGRVEEAEVLAHRASAIGDAVESQEVDNILVCQMLEIRRQQGRFEEMRTLALSAQQQFPHEFLVPLALALAFAGLGRAAEASQELSRLPAARLPGSLSGSRAVAAWAYLADVAWVMDDAGPAAELWKLLAPHAGRHVTLAVAGASVGSTDLYLGRVAALLGRWQDAAVCFDAAHAMHNRIGARAWLGHGKTDHARMLLARDSPGDRTGAVELLTEARAEFRELGLAFYEGRVAIIMDSLVEPAAASSTTASIRYGDDGWELEYGGSRIRLHDSKGLHYLARLLAHPHRGFSATDLLDDDGPVDTERARHRVTGAARSAIDRIAESHPDLGAHLRMTVRLGQTSSYVPDSRAPVTWDT
ncbi:MAG: AAA family ATPase [Actinomycetota bacterium]|nr:AAA family ATPase [Actinomycetota bacterium]